MISSVDIRASAAPLKALRALWPLAPNPLLRRDFADAGMIFGQFKLDFGMRKEPQTNANLLRNRDLPFAGDLHGITPTSKCNADFGPEQTELRHKHTGHCGRSNQYCL
jgi:hypothetical protein